MLGLNYGTELMGLVPFARGGDLWLLAKTELGLADALADGSKPRCTYWFQAMLQFKSTCLSSTNG
jgi:hypothetical protein